MRKQIYLKKLQSRGFEPFASGYKRAETGIVAAMRHYTYLLSEKQFKCHK